MSNQTEQNRTQQSVSSQSVQFSTGPHSQYGERPRVVVPQVIVICWASCCSCCCCCSSSPSFHSLMNIERSCFFTPAVHVWSAISIADEFLTNYNPLNIASVLIDWLTPLWCTGNCSDTSYRESMATMRDAFTIRRLIIAVISSVLIFQNSPVDSFPLPDAPLESSSTFKTFPYMSFHIDVGWL